MNDLETIPSVLRPLDEVEGRTKPESKVITLWQILFGVVTLRLVILASYRR